jgi:hypothetical protein
MQVNGMAMAQAGPPPPPPLQMHHDNGFRDEPAMQALPPPMPLAMPPDFVTPVPEQYPPMQPEQVDGFSASPHHTHQFAPPPQFATPAEHSFLDNGAPPPGPMDTGPPPPPSLMDQFSPPPEHYAPAPVFDPPPVHPGNGTHSLFNGFEDPMGPLGEHPMLPGHGEPSEPNPLLAALQNEALAPEAPRLEPAFAPIQPNGGAPHGRPLPPRHPPAHPHAGTNSNGNAAGNGTKPAARRAPDFSGLPPAMAESLAKLAGVPWPPRPDDEEREHEAQASGQLPGMPHREG